MWTIFIVVIIALILFHKIRASYRENEIKKYVRNHGGFSSMYSVLIESIKNDLSGAKIIELTEYSITIGNQYEYGAQKYLIKQLYGGGLLVRYDKEPNKMFNEGAIRKLWTFNDQTNQNEIMQKITHDINVLVAKQFLKI